MKKVLLSIAIALTLIVIYFNCQTEPQIEVGNIMGYNYGLNGLSHVGWKVASIAAWILYVMFNEIKNDDNGNI
jgi:hypothetical protein